MHVLCRKQKGWVKEIKNMQKPCIRRRVQVCTPLDFGMQLLCLCGTLFGKTKHRPVQGTVLRFNL